MSAAGRMRIAELGRRAGLSAARSRRPDAAARGKRAVSYRTEVNPRALGYSICAIVRVSPLGRGLRLIPAIARDVPEITECYRITGEAVTS